MKRVEIQANTSARVDGEGLSEKCFIYSSCPLIWKGITLILWKKIKYSGVQELI